MFSWIRQRFARIRSRHRGEMTGKPLIDMAALDLTLSRSRIPAVFVLVFVWAVCSVLLILSRDRQHRLVDWVDGQNAPYSINAAVDFSYVDSALTEAKREQARANEPEYFRLDSRLSNRINSNVSDFFLLIENRMADESGRRPFSVSDSLPARMAEKASPTLAGALLREYQRGGNYPVFCNLLRQTLYRGILGDPSLRSPRETAKNPDLMIRVIDSSDRTSRDSFSLKEFPTVAMAAELLATSLFPADVQCRNEFRQLLQELIGPSGNLNCDPDRTEEARARAASAVPPVVVNKTKGSPLIRKGDVFTPGVREMIDAERAATPKSDLLEAYRQMAWSFALLAAAAFFLCLISPDIRANNLRIALAGLTVTIALCVNYEAIKLFGFLLRDATIRNEELVIAAVPAALGAVIVSVILDCRTAVCCGGLIAGVTAMMIMPDRSLELALRWVAISSVAALMVRNVSNYRSFSVRTALWVFVLTWALTFDVALRGGEARIANLLVEAFWVILCNSLFCAMLALTLIFVYELIFNLSTNMALMVLCDCNHPLLERLKREAPGTMAHSMAVATLAEDAARAIGANPLRAKSGALFHDIGKLAMPQYFTENNPDSALQHMNLNPQMSSIVIRDHVKEGLELARQHRLCRFIRDVIASHHGDDLVRYFYHKALEESKPGESPVLESQFRYHGEPPVSREEGIINLADACEAASRSLKHPTPENIAGMVRSIIQLRFSDGQLRNSHLTADDLAKLEKSFISTLSNSMHGRVEYPKEPPKC